MTMDTAFDTEITDDQKVIAEALAIIDRGLGQLLHRELVSTVEASDLLLDVRSLLAGLRPEDDATLPGSN
jgi:hypothetical protein